jgi:DNA repair exonuclease SbcCD ATPase subunit/predicted MPP superfamily phosphohydrolase
MIIPVNFEKLQSVVHIADVHVRLFRRHEEYEDVFEKLYVDIHKKNLKDFVIVLAGDIVHAKTDMSPEMVQVTSKFLQNIADIAPTILIAGNHDCNLANTNRLDSLTPIVNNLQHPNLHYIKNSAVIRVADTDFAVCSILDNQSEWPTADDCEADTKIALYHGPVHGALTDANFTITNRHVHIDNFDGYDMVMLGDIHRHQVLQEYVPSINKPIIVYSSSLIQQNHGETLDGHGWCLWDIPNRTFTFVPLENDYGYCTIEVINGQIQMPSVMPKKARVRLFTGNLDNTEIKKLITKLRKTTQVIELSVNKNRYNKQSILSNTSTPTHEHLDLTQPSTQMVLINDWLKRNTPNLDPSVLSAVEQLNVELNGKIQHEDYSRNIHWRPLNFKFSNMFSYGENNEIDFTEMNGLYGIFAQNASGKSSVMDSLMFCLYDKTPRAFRGHDIMNNRKNNFECTLTFEINDEVYGIHRVGSRKKNGDVKVDVNFWKIGEDGVEISLNGESRRDTNANIRSYVGTYEDFIMTALSGQTSNALFIDKSQSERKDLLIQFMGLNIFDKLYMIANDEVKEIAGVLKRFKKSDVTDEISQTHDRLIEVKRNLTNLDTEKSILEQERIELDSKYENLQDKRVQVPQISKNLEDLQVELDKFNKLSMNQEIKLVDSKLDIAVVQKEINDDTKLLSEYNIQELEESVNTHKTLISSLNILEANMAVIDSKIQEKSELKQKLSGYNYNSECEVCVENNKSVIEDLRLVDEQLKELIKERSGLVFEIETTKIQIETLEKDVELYNTYFNLKQKIQTNQHKLDKMVSELETLEVNIQNSKIKIESIIQDIETYKQNEQAILENQKIDIQLDQIKVLISQNKISVDKMEREIRDIHGTLSVLDSEKNNLVARLREAEELETTYEAYENYMMAISRDGIPYELISKTIPNIESEINNILSQIVDFSISLEIDGKYINGKLTYDYDRVWPLENSSGMERFVSSLAIRVALMNVSNLPKPNFLIIDEGFGVLDAEHLHSMQTLFNLLKTHFDFILIVSHLDSARDMVDNLIEIKKEDGYSQISV